MSKQTKSYKLLDPQNPELLKETTDWSKCCLCQKVTEEVLQCPAKSKRHDVRVGQGYTTLSANIIQFSELHDLPMAIDLQRLDEGSGIEVTLMSHKAMWHKSCYNKFNTTKLRRAEKRKSLTEDSECENVAARKYPRRSVTYDLDTCFFCAKSASATESLREAATLRLDSCVRKYAHDLQDESLLAKLSAGDMIALEAKYHPRCLVSLYNKAAALETENQESKTDKLNHGIALAELLAYIDEARLDEDTAPIFKLSDLTKLYSSRLEHLGVKQQGRTHSTELKKRILSQIPELSAHKEGRDILLAFDDDVGTALRRASKNDYDSEAVCLARAAKIVRRDMLELQTEFTGSFGQDCQVKSVPNSLLALVDMIHNGPSIKSRSMSQATLSVAQPLQYNCCIRRRAGSIGNRHVKVRETPVPIYVGLTVHARSRKRDLIDTLFDLGLSVSYDRVMEISTAMNNQVCELYHSDHVVCPPNLLRGLFVTAAIDNIDHNPSSTTARDSFHGTGISLFQQSTLHNLGHADRGRQLCITDQLPRNKMLLELPESYTSVQPILLPNKNPPIPKKDFQLKKDCQLFSQALQKEVSWLDSVNEKYLQIIDSDSNVSWAAHHASQEEVRDCPVTAITAMLPLFHDDSKSVGMIRHSMDVIKQVVQKLNHAQVPVITLDQPLYAIAKMIQWNWQEIYGEIISFSCLEDCILKWQDSKS